MRVLWHKLVSPEPNTFGVAFAVWAVIVGASLVVPGNAFDLSPAWDSLQHIHASDAEWGWIMLSDAILMFVSLRLPTIPYKAAIIIFSSILWATLGLSMIVNAWRASFLSIAGCFSLWCSFQALLSVGQWLVRGDGNGTR